eukprot:TRINITY_DN3622_c0_g1_i1.p1 TRINITY_DN3622_c0_g1~~TRINITY_DN3622_c0_g1_i1.p1  ORF type:complete len:543 (-),score=114.39 TRINITY_DN3622_c0_g1_i1:103-1731(-)
MAPKRSASTTVQVFKDQSFCFSGDLSMKRAELEALVRNHGGSCGANVTKKTTLLVTSSNEIESKTAKVRKAQELSESCSIVSEEFVHDSIKKKKLQDPKDYSLAEDSSSASSSSSSVSAHAEEEKTIASTSRASSRRSAATSSATSGNTSNNKAPTNSTNSNKRKAESSLEKCSPKWEIKIQSSVSAIYVDDDVCLYGDSMGNIVSVNHDTGAIKQIVLLGSMVLAITRDVGGFLYVIGKDGSLYDCTDLSSPFQIIPSNPSFSNNIESAHVYDGNLVVNQGAKGCTKLNFEGEVEWISASLGNSAWTVQTDGSKVYYSSNDELMAVDFASGKELWRRKVDSKIVSGVLYDNVMYVGQNSGGSAVPSEVENAIIKYTSSKGFSVTVDEIHFYGGSVPIEIYDRKSGEKLRQLVRSTGMVGTLFVHNNKLYIGTMMHTFECITLDNPSQKTKKVKVPKMTELKCVEKLPSVAEAREGEVVCECVQEGKQLRVRPVSPGYNSKWNVQFPSNLREKGAKYVVSQLLEAVNGGYYRAKGSIQKLQM